MNLHKRKLTDTLDLKLAHTLKNWTSNNQSPADGKSRLLNAAMRASRRASTPKARKFSNRSSMRLNEYFVQIYLESFKETPSYSLQPGAMSMNYPNVIIV
jgi:hypothetical protein